MGEFKNDKYEGKGRKYSDDYFNKIKYEGDFKNGIYQRKIYDNSGYIIYEGDFINCKYDGKGKEYDIDGNIKYEGDYQNGYIIGKGKFVL